MEAQTYPDHFGTGNNIGVTTTSSLIQNSDATQSTLSGTGFLVDTIGASRFLAQATLGVNYDDIIHLTEIGIAEWMDEQISMPYVSFNNEFEQIINEIADSASILLASNLELHELYLISDCG